MIRSAALTVMIAGEPQMNHRSVLMATFQLWIIQWTSSFVLLLGARQKTYLASLMIRNASVMIA
jgi:hypothetical protein